MLCATNARRSPYGDMPCRERNAAEHILGSGWDVRCWHMAVQPLLMEARETYGQKMFDLLPTGM